MTVNITLVMDTDDKEEMLNYVKEQMELKNQ